mmetsp:Transcript_5490/g.14829  ORF Transcript_5490/g.14829 Transcript_5490/m.14829 type:complete len:142 (+) Transcript_5490:128-553(+)
MQQPPDLVSQLQAELNRVSELFYGTVGELQRDARPVSIRGEGLVQVPPLAPTTYDARQRADGFALELVQAIKNIEAVARSVPEPPNPEEQMARIRTLQEEGGRLREELQREAQVAEGKLQQLHEMHAALAEQALRVGKPRS